MGCLRHGGTGGSAFPSSEYGGPSRRARSRGLALNQEAECAVASEPNVTTIELQMGDGSDKLQL